MKFAVELSKTADEPLVSVGSMDIGGLADWSELIDVLRSAEQAHDDKARIGYYWVLLDVSY